MLWQIPNVTCVCESLLHWATKSIKELSYCRVEFSQSSACRLLLFNNALFVSDPYENIATYCEKNRFFGLHFCRRKIWVWLQRPCRHWPQLRIWWNNATRDHQFRYQSKTRVWLPMLIIVTYFLPCTVFELWLLIGPIFAVDRRVISLAHSLGWKLSPGLRNIDSRN